MAAIVPSPRDNRFSRRTLHKLALALPAPFAFGMPSQSFAQDATPGALPADVQQFAEDTYAFVNSGYISLFIVTDEGVIAIDPGSQSGPERAEAYKAATPRSPTSRCAT